MRHILFLCVVVFVSPLYAQLDTAKKITGKEVIVTGFPTEERTPAPIDKLDRAKVAAESQLRDIPSIVADLPNVVFYSQSGLDFGYSYVNIRGFDQRRQSILVNGVPQNDPEDHSVYWIDMPDLSSSTSSISIQRGAGTAFYGPPAIGGSINVVTAPSAKREILLSADYGDYNTSKLGITLNSGLIENKYAILARLSQLKSDGYRNHAFIDEKAYFLSVARYDSNLTLQLNFYGGPIKDGLDYYGIYPSDSLKSNLKDKEARKINYSEPQTYERRPEEREEFFQPHYELLSSWNLDKNLTLNNTFFYVQGDGVFDIDGTWARPSINNQSASDYYQLSPVYGNLYHFTGITDTALGNELMRAFVGNKQFGWLPRLEYRHDDGTFTIGGEFRIHRSTHWEKLLSAAKLPIDLPGDYKFNEYKSGKDVFSGYIGENYLLGDKVNLQGSVQLVSQKYRFYDQRPFYIDSAFASQNGLRAGFTHYEFTVPFLFVNPRLGVNILVSNEASVFGSISYTSREPRRADYYNADFLAEPNFQKTQFATYDSSRPNIKPEHLMDVEIGVNYVSQLNEDTRLKVGLNGYYMPFTDELVATGNKDHFGSAIVGNAERVLHYGAEFHATLDYRTLISLSADISASHNEIKQFGSYIDPSAVVGKVPIGFPSIIGGSSVLVKPFEFLAIGISGRYVGSMYGDLANSNDGKNNAYAALDGSISFKETQVIGFQSVQVRLRFNNMTNNLYSTHSEGGTFFVAAPFNIVAGLEIGL